MSVMMRQRVERMIARRTIRALHNAGFKVRAMHGEEETDEERLAYDGKNLKAVVEHLFACDTGHLIVKFPPDWDSKAGWVLFVCGNDGYDVISDYTVNLEKIVGPICDWANKFDDR